MADAYDFSKSGAGEYSVEPSKLLTYIDDDGTPKDFYATVGTIPKVKLSSVPPVSRVHDKRAGFNSCSSDQQSQIASAVGPAQAYAIEAYSYIADIAGDTTRYTTWFGAYDEDRRAAVENHFKLIGTRNLWGLTYDCTCTTAGTYAYVCTYTFRL